MVLLAICIVILAILGVGDSVPHLWFEEAPDPDDPCTMVVIG